MLKKAIAPAALLSLGLVPQAEAADYDLVLGYMNLKGTAYLEVAEGINDRISKATDGKVAVAINSSLVKGAALAPGVRDRQIDMALVVDAYYAATKPVLGVPALPGLISTADQYRSLAEGFLGDSFSAMWAQDFNSVSLMNVPFCTQILASSKPVSTVAELAGKKLRVHNPETGRLIAAAGAKPTALPAAEILPGMQQGVIDGVFTASCWAEASGLPSVTTNVSEWKLAAYLPWELLINKDALGQMPEELQQAVVDEMAQWQTELYDTYAERNRKLADKWRGHGITYTVIDDGEIETLTGDHYGGAVYDAWYKTAEDTGVDGRALVDEVRAFLNDK